MPAPSQEMHIAGKETLAFDEVILMNRRRSITPDPVSRLTLTALFARDLLR
jgi:hypothetical protein